MDKQMITWFVIVGTVAITFFIRALVSLIMTNKKSHFLKISNGGDFLDSLVDDVDVVDDDDDDD